MIERFMAKVEITDSCWNWTASVGGHGYGQFSVKKDGKWGPQLAHRVSYELHIGPIPEGLQIDHLCRNKSCVRPDHLEPVTQRVNILRSDAPSAVAHRTDTCKRGHNLTDARVRSNGARECRACSRERWAEMEHTPEQRSAAAARSRAWHAANMERVA